MSGYLWDKTGEADPEVERLEKLLAGLRYEPRELKLPAEALPPRSRAFPRRLWTAYAAAAALALIVLAGLWLAAHRHSGLQGQGQMAAGGAQSQPSQESAREEPSPGPQDVQALGPDGSGRQVVSNNSGEIQTRRAPGRIQQKGEKQFSLSSESSRAGRSRAEIIVQRLPIPRSHPQNGVAQLTREQQAAKEQLIYALRLTSIKLKEVRETIRETNNQKPAFEERNRTR